LLSTKHELITKLNHSNVDSDPSSRALSMRIEDTVRTLKSSTLPTVEVREQERLEVHNSTVQNPVQRSLALLSSSV
jgi:hypothetical protein